MLSLSFPSEQCWGQAKHLLPHSLSVEGLYSSDENANQDKTMLMWVAVIVKSEWGMRGVTHAIEYNLVFFKISSFLVQGHYMCKLVHQLFRNFSLSAEHGPCAATQFKHWDTVAMDSSTLKVCFSSFRLTRLSLCHLVAVLLQEFSPSDCRNNLVSSRTPTPPGRYSPHSPIDRDVPMSPRRR